MQTASRFAFALALTGALAITWPAAPAAASGAAPQDSAGTLAPAAAASSSWSLLVGKAPHPAPVRQSHTLVYDSQHRRAVGFGGLQAGRLMHHPYAAGLDGPGTWLAVATLDTILPRRLHAAVYDPVRDRMLVLFGYDGTYLADVQQLPLSGPADWSPLMASGTPPVPRIDFGAVYDPVGDRVLLFGGFDGTGTLYRNDVWELTLSGTPAWHLLATAGTPPSARSGSRIVLDAANHRLLMFGGANASGYLNDVWALSLSGTPTWTPVATVGTTPGGRADQVLAWDEAGQKLLVFAGFNATTSFADLWSLDFSLATPQWTRLHNGLTGVRPGAGLGQAGFWDPVRGELVVQGFDGTEEGNAYRWQAGTGWTAWYEVGTYPPSRQGHAGAYVAAHRQLVFFGGGSSSYENDTWALDLDAADRAWLPVADAGPRPPARRLHAAALDAARDRLLVFGGYDGSFRNDTWATPLGGPTDWAALAPAGAPPTPRCDLAMAVDPVGDRLIVFGGYDGFTPPANRVGDLWQLSLGGSPAWSPLAATGSPPTARSGHRFAYDPSRQRLVMFGGYDTQMLNDVWVLGLGANPAWTPLAVSGGAPAARADMVVTYDPALDRLLVFGGYDGSLVFNDLWELRFLPSPSWHQLSTGEVPGAYLSFGAWDPMRMEFLTHGGQNSAGRLQDTWVWAGPGSPTAAAASLVRAEATARGVELEWRVTESAGLTLAVERAAHGDVAWTPLGEAVPDADGSVVFTDGTAVAGAAYDYRLRWPDGHASAPVAIAVPLASARLALAVRAAPVTGDEARFDVTLAAGGGATLELFDAAGRRVGGTTLAARGAGTYVVNVRAAGAPGVCFARLTQDGEQRVARFVRLR